VAYAAPWWSWRRGMVGALRAEHQSVAYGQSPHHEPRPPPIRPQGAPEVLPVLWLVLVGGTLFIMRAWMGGLRKKSLETRMDASSTNDTASAKSIGFMRVCGLLVVELPQLLPQRLFKAASPSLLGRLCEPHIHWGQATVPATMHP